VSRGGCEITKEEDERWHDQSLDTGTDFFALNTGFLLSMMVRFMITGSLPTVDGEIGNDSTEHWWIRRLVFVGLASLCLTTFLGKQKSKMQEGTAADSLMVFLTSMSADLAAFSLMYAGLWQFGKIVGEDELMVHVLNAIAVSIAAFAFVAIASTLCPGNSMLEGSFAAFGLLAGFSWEKAFDAAADGVGDLPVFHGYPESKRYFQLILFFVVFPAWAVYILPKADDELQEAFKTTLSRGSLPLRSLCDDSGLYEGEVASEDSDESDTEAGKMR